MEINFDEVRRLIKEGFITARKHPTPGSRRFDSYPPDQTFLFTFKFRRYIVINDTRRGD